MTDKIERDFRKGCEFIMKVKERIYSLDNIQRMDYITFFQLLEECEAEQRDAIARAKEKQ